MSNQPGMSGTSGSYKCEACGTSYRSQDELNRHNKEAHGSSGTKM